ncbi:hypothetical protein ACVITL_005794 [Rhizobium pisi]
MRRSFYLLALSTSLILGASIPPPSPSLTSQSAANQPDTVLVNFLDRILQDAAPRRAKPSSQRHRKRASENKPATDRPPVPANVPVPMQKPDNQAAASDTDEHDTPVPETGPETPTAMPRQTELTPRLEQETKDRPETAAPQEADKPGVVHPDDGKPAKPETDELKPNEPDKPPLVHEDPDELKACLAELNALGTKFTSINAIDEGDGCGIEHPIKINALLPGVSLGGAIMRCKTATSLAHWLKNTVQPALDAAKPGRKIAGIIPGTTFACRLRNSASSGPISEHARGNALDVAAFKLDDGETMEMKPRWDDHTIEGAFQKAATAGACLYFTTVLAPGSDASHEKHLHVDIKDRENGYRICESP